MMSNLPASKGQATRVRTIAGLFFLAFVVTFCVSPTGYLAVRAACNNDGGYTINSTAYVAGYTVQQGYSPLCVTCLLDVRDGHFEYVDFMATDAGESDLEAFAIQRYFISSEDDIACSTVRENPRARSFVRDTDLADGSCIAVRTIDQPAAHVYVRQNRTLISALGAHYSVNEHLITNRETGDELAAFRRYSHLPLLFREVTSAAAPLYACEQEDPPFRSADFRISVLRDEDKLRGN